MLERFLGNVDQAEIEIEGTNDIGQFVRGEILDQARKAFAQFVVFLLAQPYVALAQSLDGIQDAFAGLFTQYLTQQVAEQADAAAQVLVVDGGDLYVIVWLVICEKKPRLRVACSCCRKSIVPIIRIFL